MGRMGAELDRKLDEAKYDLYYALKELLDTVRRGEPQWLARLKADKAIAKVEGK